MLERERNTEISRRDFLRLAGAGLAVEVFELDQKLQADLDNLAKSPTKETTQPTQVFQELSEESKEEEPRNGIRIIDNFGIKKDGEIFDVLVDEALIKENILSRARQIISPELYPQVETMVDKLVISFGSRSYSEVVETAIDRQNPHGSKRNISFKIGNISFKVKRWLISRLNIILNFHLEPNGGFFRDMEHPLVYINTGQISDEDELKKVWDHETAHFIYQVDPERAEDLLEYILETTALAASISTLGGVSTTLAAYGIMSKVKDVNMRTLIERNKGRFKKDIIRNIENLFIPSTLLSPAIRYKHLDANEESMRSAEKNFPTPKDTFEKMIRVVPSGSQ